MPQNAITRKQKETISKKMKTIIKLAFIFSGVVLIIQCSNDDDLLLNRAILQGTWVEVEPKDLVQFAGENHTYTFKEDSFFLKLHSWTDMLLPDDTLTTEGNIYAKGTYRFDTKIIEITGEICNSTFSEKRGNLPDFNSKYNYLIKATNEILLNPEVEETSITLIKK